MPPAAGWRLFVTHEGGSAKHEHEPDLHQPWAPRLVETLSALTELPFDRLCINVRGRWSAKATDGATTAAVNGALQRMAARAR